MNRDQEQALIHTRALCGLRETDYDDLILQCLNRCNWNPEAAARLFGKVVRATA